MLQSINSDDLTFIDAPQIVWIRVSDAIPLLWSENPKLHDIGATVESILKYGFQELPKYDGTLTAIKAGNGRVETLHLMENDKVTRAKLKELDLLCPRGLAVDGSGFWVMPVLVGTDAPSVALAKAYAIDSNNLTMSGGDFTAIDMSRLWDTDKYRQVLNDLSDKREFFVSVDSLALDGLNTCFDDLLNEQPDTRGKLLEKLIGFGVGEPRSVGMNEVYKFDKHILVVCDLINDWSLFIEYLKDGAAFIPFAGVFIFTTEIARRPLVIVQPDVYIAGLMLDLAEIVYGFPVVRLS